MRETGDEVTRSPVESGSGLARGVWLVALVAAVLVVDLALPFLVTVDDVVDAVAVQDADGVRLMVAIMFAMGVAGRHYWFLRS